MQYMGIDPGIKNYAVVGINANGVATYARMLNNTIYSTAQANADLRAKFYTAMRGILANLRPRALIVESYVVRGFGTNQIEMGALMSGTVQALCRELCVDEHMVMPSTWKRELKKAFGESVLDKLYSIGKNHGAPPHVVDALCLAIYLRSGKTYARTDEVLLKQGSKAVAALIQPYRRIGKGRKR